MSNLNDVYVANPLTSLPLDALIYALDNPGETGGDDDAGINVNDLIAQIIGTKIEGARLAWNSASSIDIGTGLLAAENRDVINITSAITKSSLSLSASTWYHVYVYLSSGSPAAEVVTTAPAAWKGSAYSKTGDTSRRYVGSVKTDGSGNVYSFIMNDNRISYRQNSVTSPFRILNGGTATTETSVSAAAVVPPTSRMATVRIYNSATTGNLVTGTSDDNITLSGTAGLTITAPANTTVHARHPLNTSQALTYLYNTTPSGGGASGYIDVYGYIFDR